MISYVTIKNFRSIVDVTLDMRYGEGKAPNGYLESERLPFLLEKGCKERIVPCLALFGSNANGKTNILKALLILQTAVRNSRIDIRHLYDPNVIVTARPEESEFAIGFVQNGDAYDYRIVYSNEGLKFESLFLNGTVLYSIAEDKHEFSCIATKQPYDEAAIEEIFRVECGDGEGRWIRPLLNALGHRFRGLNQFAQTAFRMLANDMQVFIDGHEPGMFPLAVEMLRDAMRCDRETALAEVVEVVRKLAVEIKGITVTEQLADPGGPRSMVVRHDYSTQKDYNVFINASHENDRGEMVVFNFMTQESEGTVRLATIVAHLLRAIHLGVPMFVDELDRSLHPLLVRAVLSLFQQRERNKNRAQLIFTTHCTDLLDDEILRLSEIGIVLKNIKLGTKVKRLCDFRKDGTDIRNVTNFRNRYLEGFYSGVPYPEL